MSVLEFISSIKWPIVALIALVLFSRAVKRSPGLGAWVREWFDSRDMRGKFGPAEFEATASGARDAAQIAAASDDDLAELAAEGRDSASGAAEEVGRADITALRREAVEEVMRQAAGWGWSAAKAGYVELPRAVIEWDEQGRPSMVSRPSIRDVGERVMQRLRESRAFDVPLSQVLQDMERRREQREANRPATQGDRPD